jgi:hypothetical protein
MNLEVHNLREIEGLSQRGTTLSIVHLINANTLNVDMAAYSLYAIANGASFLTAARPGNAGKTTLLACLMTFLPPGIEIITTSSPSVVAEAEGFMENREPRELCFLCHEIGSGHWYGYLWGEYVGQFFHLMNSGCRIASCIHADTLPELYDILVSGELGVSEGDFSQLGLILFMHIERRLMEYRRRVIRFYESSGAGGHNLLFAWEPKADTFEQLRESLLLKRVAIQRGLSIDEAKEELQRCKTFVENLMRSGETDFRWVREQVVKFYLEKKLV